MSQPERSTFSNGVRRSRDCAGGISVISGCGSGLDEIVRRVGEVFRRPLQRRSQFTFRHVQEKVDYVQELTECDDPAKVLNCNRRFLQRSFTNCAQDAQGNTRPTLRRTSTAMLKMPFRKARAEATTKGQTG